MQQIHTRMKQQAHFTRLFDTFIFTFTFIIYIYFFTMKKFKIIIKGDLHRFLKYPRDALNYMSPYVFYDSMNMLKSTCLPMQQKSPQLMYDMD